MQDWPVWDGVGEDEELWRWAGVDPLPVGWKPKSKRAAATRKVIIWETGYRAHVCPVCGREYFDKSNKLYCSSPCQKKAYKLRVKGKLKQVYFPGQNKGPRGGHVHHLVTVDTEPLAISTGRVLPAKETDGIQVHTVEHDRTPSNTRDERRKARRESRRERRRKLRAEAKVAGVVAGCDPKKVAGRWQGATTKKDCSSSKS